MMDFDTFINEVYKIYSMNRLATNLRMMHDDYGAHYDCDCGCGGDTFDWDEQRDAYAEADELDRQAEDMLEKLRQAWGDMRVHRVEE